jgi:hypothetical protein
MILCPKESLPPCDWLPTESGVPAMGYVHDRPPPDTQRPGPRQVMGQIHHRPDPTTLCPFVSFEERPMVLGPLSDGREWQIERYCRAEARREVESWFRGAPYRFTPWDERRCRPEEEMEPLQPLDFFELVK